MGDIQRAFIHLHPEYTHNIAWTIEDDDEMPAAIIKFSDGCHGVVELMFDGEEDLENFKYLMKCFIESAESMFSSYKENEGTE